MTVSVTIATYRRPKMVAEAVEAALHQTLPPDEVIVFDDASGDETPATIGAIAARDPRVKILVQPKNTGGVPNWSAAVNAATSEFIAWCSDDDLFLPNHLETAVGYLKAHPEVGLVHLGFVDRWQADDGTWKETPSPFAFDDTTVIGGLQIVPYLIRHYSWPFHPSTMVFRRAMWESVRPFDERFALADTDWFIRVAQQWPIAFVPERTIVNRRHSANWSSRVGSVKMHCEVDDAMRSMLAAQRGRQSRLRLIAYGAAWRANHIARLARLYVARSRAGEREVVSQIIDALWQAFGGRSGSALRPLLSFPLTVAARLLRMIQVLIPGGRRKYETLGMFVPK